VARRADRVLVLADASAPAQQGALASLFDVRVTARDARALA
jgi:hypothetical protein